MAVINLLDKLTINRIAAGEVIERPASVVKELIENSIDSGANAVTCEIGGGGIDLIRITDNGCGIEKDDIPTAFLRHATSKIRTAEDLDSVRSLGFRGEALASVAAVAEVELLTKTREAFVGQRYIIKDGEEVLFEEIGCPEGTTFIVRNLFESVPVRRKFLKSPVTEAGYITEAMERLAISHPAVSFKFINNGRTVFFTNGGNSVKNIIYSLYGRDIASELTEVSYDTEGIRLTGYIAKPLVARSNRNLETYYVNGRFVRNNVMIKAIEDAYSPFLMQHKYPFTVLYVDIDSDLIDVNVHPAKLEVRFRDQERLFDTVYHAVSVALKTKALVPDMAAEPVGTSEKKETEKAYRESVRLAPEPFEQARRNAVLNEEQAASDTETTTARQTCQAQTSAAQQTCQAQTSVAQQTCQAQAFMAQQTCRTQASAAPQTSQAACPLNEQSGSAEPFAVQADHAQADGTFSVQPSEPPAPQSDPAAAESAQQAAAKPVQMKLDLDSGTEISGIREETKEDFKQGLNDGYRIVGQVFNTYWILERGNKMYMIDQHAAHEKIIYERLVSENQALKNSSQLLSPPMVISLSPSECNAVEANKEELAELGYTVENFGGREYTVSSVPLQLYKLDPKDLLMEIIASFADSDYSHGKGRTITLKERLATCSCKAAVKGNTKLSYEEARRLIEDLLKLDNPFNCPHGRPVVIEMTDQELEKKFKRIV